MFRLQASFSPRGDQPKAIRALTAGIQAGKKSQVLLGITGSGKTFTMANVIENVQKPTLILAHNKTLAAQLYQEFSTFFPDNAVEYFVSYYDYYQPEAYVARTDTYIEKDLSINEQVEKMRLSATRSLMERRDVIIVASISCIYGLGSPEYYAEMLLELFLGKQVRRDDVLMHLVDMQYKRNDFDLVRGTFRVRGDIVDIVPAYEDDIAYRVVFFGDEIEMIQQIDPLTGKRGEKLEKISIYPGSHYVTPEEARLQALTTIQEELQERKEFFAKEKRFIEEQRIAERTSADMVMIKEIGFCKGIENYSRHFSKRQKGDPPPCLLDYFPKDFLLLVDESHQTIPQMHAMYKADLSRKTQLVEFGFRLPSAFDNRPLQFQEAYQHFHNVVYISATPGKFEIEEAKGDVIPQIIRPTGLLDPQIEVRSASTQVDDALEEIRKETEKNSRILVTTLTKKLAEDLSKYLLEIGVKAKYIHADIDTLERIHILKSLRLGEFDVLVGINLLREGLDLPEVSLVMILDADKEGFLRSETALIQTCGRAARNVHGRVIMYGDKHTKAMQSTIAITSARRQEQQTYNEKHGITPKSVNKQLAESLEETFGIAPEQGTEKPLKETFSSREELEQKIKECKVAMKKAAAELSFEEAARLRDLIRYYQSLDILS